MVRRTFNTDRCVLVAVSCLFFVYYLTHPAVPDSDSKAAPSHTRLDKNAGDGGGGMTGGVGRRSVNERNQRQQEAITHPPLVWGRAFVVPAARTAAADANVLHAADAARTAARLSGDPRPVPPVVKRSATPPAHAVPVSVTADDGQTQNGGGQQRNTAADNGGAASFSIDAADPNTPVRSVVREYAVNRHDDPDVAFAVANPLHTSAKPNRQELIDGLYDTRGAVDPIASIPSNPANRGAPYVSTVQLANAQMKNTVQRELGGPPKFALEVGSFVGSGIVHCWAPLMAMEKSRTAQLLSIDTWQGDVNMRVLAEPFQHTMRYLNGHPEFDETLRYRLRANGFEKHIAMLHMPSLLGARFVQARGWQPDFIFIDTAHEIGETFAEISLYFNLLRPGGLLSGDDYTPHSHNSFTGVKHDVDLFAAYYGLEKFVEGVMWYIRKPKNFTDTAAALEARRGNDLESMMAKMWSAHRDPVRTNPFSRERFHPYRQQWGKAFFTPSLFAVMSLVHYYAPGMGPPPQLKHGHSSAHKLPSEAGYRHAESVSALSKVYSLAVAATPQSPSLPTSEVVEKFAPPPLNVDAVTSVIESHFGNLPSNSRASLQLTLQVGVNLGHTTVQLLAPIAKKNNGIVFALDTFHGTVGQRLRMGGKYNGLFELANGMRPTLYSHFLRHVHAAGLSDVVVPFAMGTVVGGRVVHSARWLCGLVWLESSGERGETYAELSSATASLAPGGLLMGRLPMGRGAATMAGAKADIELFLRHRGYPALKMIEGAEGVWSTVRPMAHATLLEKEVDGTMAFEA